MEKFFEFFFFLLELLLNLYEYGDLLCMILVTKRFYVVPLLYSVLLISLYFNKNTCQSHTFS